MKMNYNVTGEDRKRMVRIISEATGQYAIYTRMPECAYVIGDLKVSKTGELIRDESTEIDVIATVTTALETEGFIAEEPILPADADAEDTGNADNLEDEEVEGENTFDEPDGLSFSFPRADFTDMALNNLKNLVASKATLIAKSLQADGLNIEIADDKITFPWWDRVPTPREIAAYGEFLAALVKMAKEAKRVTAKEHPTESEKYTFRTFLLRLGFIGPEHKETRAILMKPLSGYAAFKNKADAEAFYARLKAQRAEQDAVGQDDAKQDAASETTEDATGNTVPDGTTITTAEEGATNEISE